MAKTAKKESVERQPPLDPKAFDHLTREERFILFVLPALGSARAHKCVTVDFEAVKREWAGFTKKPFPINLD